MCDDKNFNHDEFLEEMPGYVTADLHYYKYLKDIRKILIENQTSTEQIMWKFLKSKKTGYNIRRQHVIDNYIVDFVCLRKKLVIEIDGDIHLYQGERDMLRTFILNLKGYKVIRFSNDEVFQNPSLVFQKIKRELDDMSYSKD